MMTPSWFVGFFEGDGSFVVTSRGELHLVLTQSKANRGLLEAVQRHYGCGTLLTQGERVDHWMVRRREDIASLLPEFHGHLVLPRRKEEFHRFLTAFNGKAPHPVVYRRERRLPTWEDDWLLGFTEAEGSFTASLLAHSKAFRLGYILSQRGDVNLPVLGECIRLFGGGRVEGHSSKDNYSYVLSGVRPLVNLFPYFDPRLDRFQGRKGESYLLFREVHRLLALGVHLDPLGRSQVEALVHQIHSYGRKEK